MSEKGYNGWTNYETWLCALWWDNDQGLYSMRGEQAEELVRDHSPLDENDGYGRMEAEIAFAGWIEDFTKENLLPEIEGFAADLLNSAVSEINWREIAENWLSEYKDEPSEVTPDEAS